MDLQVDVDYLHQEEKNIHVIDHIFKDTSWFFSKERDYKSLQAGPLLIASASTQLPENILSEKEKEEAGDLSDGGSGGDYKQKLKNLTKSDSHCNLHIKGIIA